MDGFLVLAVRGWWRGAIVCASLAILLTMLAAGVARADEPSALALAPRVAVDLNKLSVVLIVANGKLLTFVDRLEDNAPVADATLALTAEPENAALPVEHLASGMFAAAWQGRGVATRIHVHVASAAEAAAEDTVLVLPPNPAPAAETPTQSETSPRQIALTAAVGFIGAIGAFMLIWASRWLMRSRREKLPPSAMPQI